MSTDMLRRLTNCRLLLLLLLQLIDVSYEHSLHVHTHTVRPLSHRLSRPPAVSHENFAKLLPPQKSQLSLEG